MDSQLLIRRFFLVCYDAAAVVFASIGEEEKYVSFSIAGPAVDVAHAGNRTPLDLS